MSMDAITTLFPWVLPLGSFFLAIFLLLLVVLLVSALQDRRSLRQQEALTNYAFPASYLHEVKTHYPHLSDAEVASGFEQLRFYFSICRERASKTVAMPSRLVDFCWHVFICDTHRYSQFCDDVFGRFLHHMPRVVAILPLEAAAEDAEVAKTESKEVKGQRLAVKAKELEAARVYQWAAMTQEPADDAHKTLLDKGLDLPVPLLFSIDRTMQIPDGYFYSAEVIRFLATYDIKAAESEAASLDSSSAGSLGAGCGDGGVSCGGCGGST